MALVERYLRARDVMLNNDYKNKVKKMYHEEYEDEDFLDRLIHLNKAHFFSILEMSGSICAVCTYYCTNEYILLENLVIDKEWRSNGVGSSFIRQYVTKRCLDDQLNVILAAEEDEVEMYRKLKCSIDNKVVPLFTEYYRKDGGVMIGQTTCRWNEFSCKDTRIRYDYVFVLYYDRYKKSDGCESDNDDEDDEESQPSLRQRLLLSKAAASKTTAAASKTTAAAASKTTAAAASKTTAAAASKTTAAASKTTAAATAATATVATTATTATAAIEYSATTAKSKGSTYLTINRKKRARRITSPSTTTSVNNEEADY